MFAGLESRRSTAGPLAHTPEDIALFMSAYMAQKPWEMDQDVLPIPWRAESEVMPSGPLCFAIAWGDEDVGLRDIVVVHAEVVGHSSPSHHAGTQARCRQAQAGWTYRRRVAGTAEDQ